MHIDSSARIEGSDSRALGHRLVEQLKQKFECKICYRDVNIGLHLLTPEHMTAFYTPEKERNQKQRNLTIISNQLVAEIMASDTIIITLPMYNYNIPTSLKMWQDLVMREGLTFKSTPNGVEGLLKNKTAYVIVTNGGMAVSNPDNLIEQLMRLFLSAMGVEQISFIHAGELAYKKQQSLSAAKQQIANI